MINRRRFLKILAGGTAASLLPIDKLYPLVLAETQKTHMGIVMGADTAATVRKAVELVGGMSSFVSKGDIVFVKPNMSWDRVPEQAATTNPLVVETVVKMAFEAGARKVTVADNPCNDARRSYERSGIKSAAEKAGARVPFMEKRKFQKVNIGGTVLTEWPVFKDALDADKIINIPIAKHHGLPGVTLSMKNMMGLIGGARNRLHQRLDESIVDLTAFFKPTLHILDAVRLLKANGPQGGSLKDVRVLNTIAASADPVRIEAFGATLFGKNPEEFRHIRLGVERGLGSSDFRSEGLEEMELG